MDEKIRRLADIMKFSKRIVFFGGAGVSTASNIPDFRSSHGIFNIQLRAHLTPEQLVSHTIFSSNPEVFFDFYRHNLLYPNAQPNGCHIALARLERMGKLKAIVTQNIDGLHQAAGSKKVYEIHGSIHRNFCMGCGKFYPMEYIYNFDGVPRCTDCGEIIRPDIVLYEEGLNQQVMSEALNAITLANTLIVGGSSLVVYPAAGLLDYFKGNNLVIINKTPTHVDRDANLVINDDVSVVMKEAVDLLAEL